MNDKSSPGGPETGRLQKAVMDALDLLGDNSSRALLFHLKSRYGIDVQSGKVVLTDLQSALRELLGPGADVIMNAIRMNLGD